jgi:transcriptional regulator GlxA family with amidase domain
LAPDVARTLMSIQRELFCRRQRVTERAYRALETLIQTAREGHLDTILWPQQDFSTGSRALAAETARLISDRLSEIRSVGHLSSLVGVSREHLSRNFRKHLGCSVWSFVTALRVEKTKELLRSPMLVKEIANEVGFGSPSSLSRAFVRLVGVRPTEYRRDPQRVDQPLDTVSANRRPTREST